MEGLRLALSFLQRRDLQTADRLLTNMVRTPDSSMLPPLCVQEVLQHTPNISPPCFASLQGFSVRTQLHSIGLHTVDKDLREFVVRSGANQSQRPALTIPPPPFQVVPPFMSSLCLVGELGGGAVSTRPFPRRRAAERGLHEADGGVGLAARHPLQRRGWATHEVKWVLDVVLVLPRKAASSFKKWFVCSRHQPSV